MSLLVHVCLSKCVSHSTHFVLTCAFTKCTSDPLCIMFQTSKVYLDSFLRLRRQCLSRKKVDIYFSQCPVLLIIYLIFALVRTFCADNCNIFFKCYIFFRNRYILVQSLSPSEHHRYLSRNLLHHVKILGTFTMPADHRDRDLPPTHAIQVKRERKKSSTLNVDISKSIHPNCNVPLLLEKLKKS